jgi:hypothetical protein
VNEQDAQRLRVISSTADRNEFSFGFGWFVKATNFSDKLQRSGSNLFRRNRRIKIEERSDISAFR